MGKVAAIILILVLFTLSFVVSGYITYQTMKHKKNTTAADTQDGMIDVDAKVSEIEE